MHTENKTIDIELEKKLLTDMRKLIGKTGTKEQLNLYFFDNEITRNEIYCDLQHNINVAFLWACVYRKVSLVSYLLTSPELPIHADIHTNNDEAIFNVTEMGCTFMIEFLLTSPELKEHIDITPLLDEIIENMVANFVKEDYDYHPSGDANAFTINQDIVDSLNYLIFDYNINPSDNIIQSLKEETKSWFYEPAIEQLNKNQLFNHISDKVKTKPITSQKKKQKI